MFPQAAAWVALGSTGAPWPSAPGPERVSHPRLELSPREIGAGLGRQEGGGARPLRSRGASALTFSLRGSGRLVPAPAQTPVRAGAEGCQRPCQASCASGRGGEADAGPHLQLISGGSCLPTSCRQMQLSSSISNCPPPPQVRSGPVSWAPCSPPLLAALPGSGTGDGVVWAARAVRGRASAVSLFVLGDASRLC